MVTVKHLTFQPNLTNKQITLKKNPVQWKQHMRKETFVGSLFAEMFISNAIWRKRYSVKWCHPLGSMSIYIYSKSLETIRETL